MTEEIEAREEAGRFRRDLQCAQAKATLDGLFISLFANSFVALSTATLLWRSRPNPLVGWWFAFILLLNALRFASAYLIRKEKYHELSPKTVLYFLAAGALVGGIGWAFVPIFIANITNGGQDGYVVFIIAGISAGALIQNTAYAWGALCFLLPPLAALDFIMLFSGDLSIEIVGLNSVLLTIMMVRGSFEAQTEFYKRTRSTLEATEMARSLAVANSQIVQSNAKLEILANRDPLTGLANRARFNKELSESLPKTADASQETALIIFDIDRFKAINDTHGHKTGDALLVEFSNRLTGLAGPGDLLARLGGDEFSAILSGPNAFKRASLLASGIVESFREPLTIEGARIHSGASAGIAVAPTHAIDTDTIFTCADLALYSAKESGRRCVKVFDESLRDQLDRKRIIEASLASALHENMLQAYFQPQVSLMTGKVIGFESLLRWQHADLGEIKPFEVAEAAVNCNIADKVTGFMLTKACDFLAGLDPAYRDDLTIAVNISPRELTNQSPLKAFLAITEHRGIKPQNLEIEITEETLYEVKTSNDQLQALKSAGFKIAIDDFGMGHSSLSYLIDMRVDRLKIDRNFVANIAANSHNQALVSAILNVGKALGIDILAEGVETEEDARMLLGLGADHVQGFLFAPAMPDDEAARWLAQHENAASGKIGNQ